MKPLQVLRDKLRAHEPDVCGEAPEWIVNEVAERLDQFLRKHSGDISIEDARRFLVGGMRFVTHIGNYGCEELGNALCRALDSLCAK